MNLPDGPTECQPVAVEYACPQTDRPRYRSLLPPAVWLGAVPLVAGTSDFLLWVFLRINALAVVGLVIILGGVVCVAIGLTLLLIHAVLNWTLLWRNDDRADYYRRSFFLTVALLLSNFPVSLVTILCALVI